MNHLDLVAIFHAGRSGIGSAMRCCGKLLGQLN